MHFRPRSELAAAPRSNYGPLIYILFFKQNSHLFYFVQTDCMGGDCMVLFHLCSYVLRGWKIYVFVKCEGGHKFIYMLLLGIGYQKLPRKIEHE